VVVAYARDKAASVTLSRNESRDFSIGCLKRHSQLIFMSGNSYMPKKGNCKFTRPCLDMVRLTAFINSVTHLPQASVFHNVLSLHRIPYAIYQVCYKSYSTLFERFRDDYQYLQPTATVKHRRRPQWRKHMV
jgi:hypothetical protein